VKKLPLFVISGTVIGTIGVVSYVPGSMSATRPLTLAPPTKAAPASSPVAHIATAPKTKKLAKKPKRVAARHKTTTKKKVATTKRLATKRKTATSGAQRTIAGSTFQTPFGPVQVQITVRGKQIISARALQTPQGGRSSMINQQAVPYLIQETLAAQSANIQGVGGATYTSEGWMQSLQAALSRL
jgi:uncharacterized protein with FMN-binding domain